MPETTHSLHRGENFTACRSGMMQPDFTMRRLMQHLHSDRKFAARPTGMTHSRTRMTQPDFQRGIDAAPAVR
ncbi:hypothetical protein NDU88_006185 [Pleurodeles waltl]|uniref:Uncharacterized protein n=1 Tax=Pleurodeles waltl TaxID=8319 RepID=A0AAV7TXS1_PLEWA|nr:hypothetical protein NDU88_006185 [Pleurodeles waltl]